MKAGEAGDEWSMSSLVSPISSIQVFALAEVEESFEQLVKSLRAMLRYA